jgi:hypothetical protein
MLFQRQALRYVLQNRRSGQSHDWKLCENTSTWRFYWKHSKTIEKVTNLFWHVPLLVSRNVVYQGTPSMLNYPFQKNIHFHLNKEITPNKWKKYCVLPCYSFSRLLELWKGDNLNKLTLKNSYWTREGHYDICVGLNGINLGLHLTDTEGRSKCVWCRNS